MNKNPIIKRVFYLVKMNTSSPLTLGNGTDELTDNDLLRDADGKPFIPGTSIAGVMQRFVNINLNMDNEAVSYKYSGNDYKQSPIFVSDALTEDSKSDIRDGIRLDENKITVDSAKYDFEIVPMNTQFVFHIEVVIRKNDENLNFEHQVEKFLQALSAGDVTFGEKTTRGYGNMKVKGIWSQSFDKSNLNDFLNFDISKMESQNLRRDLMKDVESQFHEIKVKMQINGSLMIRQYSESDKADYKQIGYNGTTALIPGTSWNGLLRKTFSEYSDQIIHDENKMNEWFGYVDNNHKNESIKSKIIINESAVKNGNYKTVVRNKIDRFTGGTVDQALFTEKPYFGGETALTIKIPKSLDALEKDYIVGIFVLFVLEDLRNGFIALGGETAIGRGLFNIDKDDITVDGQIPDEQFYRQRIRKYMDERGQ